MNKDRKEFELGPEKKRNGIGLLPCNRRDMWSEEETGHIGILQIIEWLKLPISNSNVRFQFKFALSCPPPFRIILSSYNLGWQPLRPFWKASEVRSFPSCCSNTFVRWHYWSQTQQEVSHPTLLIWTCSSKKQLIETTIKTIQTIETVPTGFCWSRHHSSSRSPPGKWKKDNGNVMIANDRTN